MCLFDHDLALKEPHMIKLQRTFHPVGQGAFYTEEFFSGEERIFTVVYDCGSETAPKVDFEAKIEGFKKRISHIDILFLSHFHADHINGLDKLLEGVKVEKTIIPMLPQEVLLLTRVQNFIKYRDDALAADGVISDLYLGGQTRARFGEVVAVLPDNYDSVSSDIFVGGSNKVQNGSVVKGYEQFWEYLPFNSIDIKDQRAIIFNTGFQKIKKAFNNAGELDVSKLIRGCRRQVKELYKQVMNGTNDNLYTLAVESCPAKNVYPYPDPRLSRCLYLGDFDSVGNTSVWNRLVEVFSLKDIGTIQVPHHGSRNNWRADLLQGDPRDYVASAGYANQYHHPDYWVIRDIINAGHSAFVVDENAGSIKEYVFTIW